jgi:hypothetical protein
MSFVLGGILVAAALFGGGLEIKELKLPQIGMVARVLTALVGIGFIVLAIYLNPKKTEPDAKVTEFALPKTTQTFPAPMQGDFRLDACEQWAQKCGEPAASAWCRAKGFARAVDFPEENVGKAGVPTRLIGTNQVCRESICTSFVYITCEK